MHDCIVRENEQNEGQLCQAKGFICEICNKMPPIYPFQLESTVLCRRCNVRDRVYDDWQAVFHKQCFTTMENCPKCKRQRERRLKEKEEMGDFSEQLVPEERHQPMMKTLDGLVVYLEQAIDTLLYLE